jgi:hypothetical protein
MECWINEWMQPYNRTLVTKVTYAVGEQIFGQMFWGGGVVKSYENEPGRGGIPPPFLSLATEVSGQLQAVATLTLVNEPLVPTRQEAGWAPEGAVE